MGRIVKGKGRREPLHKQRHRLDPHLLDHPGEKRSGFLVRRTGEPARKIAEQSRRSSELPCRSSHVNTLNQEATPSLDLH